MKPVIDFDHPDLADNKYGFEGGTVVKVDGTYHMFVGEMAGDPFWVRMRQSHWTSSDAVQWKRQGTIVETSGQPMSVTGRHYESVWATMPVFNKAENHWDMFYVGYLQGGASAGKLWRAISSTPGRGGIGGPYQEIGVIMQPDADSQPWEGEQGTDSFFPYQVGKRWYAFYGSHKVRWEVGLAEAGALAGPWKRCATGNPSPIENVFIENPIVSRIGDRYVAIYDATTVGASTYQADGHVVGYSCSADGIHWLPGGRITVQKDGAENWSTDIRTPLCLIDEGKGVFTMLYTGEDKARRFFPVGLVRLKLAKGG